MASTPQNSVPSISPAEIQILISRTGLVLNPGQVADLVLAWRQVAGLIADLDRTRPFADDMALVFRLPPPAAEAARPAGDAARDTVPGAKRKAGSRTAATAKVPAAPPDQAPAKTPARTPARAKAAAPTPAKAQARTPAKTAAKAPAKTAAKAPATTPTRTKPAGRAAPRTRAAKADRA